MVSLALNPSYGIYQNRCVVWPVHPPQRRKQPEPQRDRCEYPTAAGHDRSDHRLHHAGAEPPKVTLQASQICDSRLSLKKRKTWSKDWELFFQLLRCFGVCS
jgi:hypothetical protein